MNDYITVTDVDDVLGDGWEGTADPDRAVLEANAWMTARGVYYDDPVEGDIITAGAYVAELAAEDLLYADIDPALKRKRVKADTVESETEYQDGAASVSGRMRFINDLLSQYMAGGGGNQIGVVRI